MATIPSFYSAEYIYCYCKDNNQKSKFKSEKERSEEPYPDDIGLVLKDYKHHFTVSEDDGTHLLTTDGGKVGTGGVVVSATSMRLM